MKKSLLTLGIIITTSFSAFTPTTPITLFMQAPVRAAQKVPVINFAAAPTIKFVNSNEYAFVRLKSGNQILVRKILK